MTLTPSKVNQGAAGSSAWPVTFLSVPTIVEKQDQTAIVQTTWTSATSVNTTTASYACTGYGTANVGISVPTTCTAGVVTIEISQDGGGQRGGAGLLAHFAPNERRTVRAISDARIVLVLSPWPGEGHPSRH